MDSKKYNSINNIIDDCNKLLSDLDIEFMDTDILINKAEYKINKSMWLGRRNFHISPSDGVIDDEHKEYTVYVHKNTIKIAKFTEDGMIALNDKTEDKIIIFTNIIKDEVFEEFRKATLVNHIPKHLEEQNLINIEIGLKINNALYTPLDYNTINTIIELSKEYPFCIILNSDYYFLKNKDDIDIIENYKKSDSIALCQLNNFDEFLINTINNDNFKQTIILDIKKEIEIMK